tara:strand:+ start:13146 stop:15275 length:2130 start_codon:yes stop_codon:yes gene_type:complete
MSPIFNPWYFLFILIITSLIIYFSYRSLLISLKKHFLFLFLVRFFIISIILFLLLNISIFQTKILDKIPVTKVYFDNSISAQYHQSISKESLINSYNDILFLLKSNDVNLKFKPNIKSYSFGEKVSLIDSPLDMKIDESSTDFSSIISTFDENSVFEDLQNIIILTDGQSTLGDDPFNSFNKIKTPVYTIGIGENYKLVDLKINKVNVPTYAIEGDPVTAEVILNFKGEINQRINVSLENNKELIGTQIISSGRDGSNKIVRFQFNANQNGLNEYLIKVSTVRDEINIDNNIYRFNMNIIKKKFNIAILTGSASFNTRLIKLVLSDESKYSIDHYVNSSKFWNNPISNFWKKKYDLIILDNFPTLLIPERWSSDLNRKINNENSSLAFFPGNNTNNNDLKSYLKIFELEINESILVKNDDLTKYPIVGNNSFNNNPLIISQTNWELMPSISPKFNLNYNQEGMYSPAFFDQEDLLNPIFLIGKDSNNDFKKFIVNSSDLWTLYFKHHDDGLKKNINLYFKEVFKWLVSISGEDNRYFRLSNQSSIQIGEEIVLEGNFLDISDEFLKNNIWWRILLPSNKVRLVPLVEEEDGVWRGRFITTEKGEHNYWVVFENEEYNSLNSSTFNVNEGLLELKNVFLNKEILEDISSKTNGTYISWKDKNKISEMINYSAKKEKISNKISFSHLKEFLFLLLILLTLEWVVRRKIGLQ